MANDNDETETETTEDLIEGTKEAKGAAHEAVTDTEGEASQLQEELDRRAAEQSADPE